MKKILWIIFGSLFGILLLVMVISLVKAIQLKSSLEENEYFISESFNNIDIDVDTDEVNIFVSDDNVDKVIAVENKGIVVETKVVNNTLLIKRFDKRNFFDRFFNFGKFKIDLYLSKEVIDSLDIEASTGNINIGKGLTFESVDIELSTGNINFLSNVTNHFGIEISTGNVNIKDFKTLGNVEIESSTGNINIENGNCESLEIEISTGKTKLTHVIVAKDLIVEGSTGDVILDGFDAENININLSTGDVKGTIITSKFFIVNTDTGKINVPETKDGGTCRINTDTGDINISYYK